MPNFKCNVCDELFTGEDALEDIQEHLLTCAVTKITTVQEAHLFKRLLETFPVIAAMEYEEHEDYDEPNYLRITRQDGSEYKVAYQYGSTFSNRKEEEPFDVARRGIEYVESLILEITSAVKTQAPQSDIHFSGVRSNSGYAGNGYHFSFTVNGKTETLTHYKNGGGIKKLVEKIVSFYTTEISGVLTRSNDEYTIDGVSVNQWLLNHVGKDVWLTENKSK